MGVAALYAQDLPSSCPGPAVPALLCPPLLLRPICPLWCDYGKLLRKRQVKFCIVLKSFGSNVPLNDVLLHLEAPELCVAF